ncbi:hypothetical protein V3429_05335 [Aeromonas jandaei]|uniref:hypothetical protein n=1 Tax=Aeromonas TaxID=642 RepID=UPI001C2277A1|nr:hypothetical protein [Aeromonas sp. FDAARGOS 1410]QXC40049.1 hypothetical protein I6L40_09620 [Aeromonas sp. FDAARGOS 1410]
MHTEKYEFPSRGFHIVATKVAEADYFLDKLKDSRGLDEEFSFLLSAFASAARSITFSLQAVMSKYPGFDDWYKPHQECLKSNDLARYFVDLRNYLQKVGEVPVGHSGAIIDGMFRHVSFFISIDRLKEAPSGDVIHLAENYFIDILKVVEACYRDYWVYVDPRALFTLEGLSQLGWSIEDVEACGGLPRGYTDVPYDGDDKNIQRLRLLSRELQGDEVMEQYFEKYSL